jgi:hypothetical protein
VSKMNKAETAAFIRKLLREEADARRREVDVAIAASVVMTLAIWRFRIATTRT